MGRSVLVTGATGAVGSHLIPALLAAGHAVRCLVRRPEALRHREWAAAVEVAVGDVTDEQAVREALAGVDAAYYLVHALATAGPALERAEERMSEVFRDGLTAAGAPRVIYLGGLVDEEELLRLSAHMFSRWRVGRVLAASTAALTEVRAAIVVHPDSASFRILRALAERLPVRLTSAWSSTRCQPIAMADVVDDLVEVLHEPGTAGRVLETGGADVLTYEEMLTVLREELGLPPAPRVPVPSVGPEAAAPLVRLLAGVPAGLGLSLLASARLDAVVGDRPIDRFIDREPMSYRDAVRRALDAGSSLSAR